MSSKKTLSPEQEALIPIYVEKWKELALSTKPIDFEAAKKAIENAYQFLDKKVPEIVYCPSLYSAFQQTNINSWGCECYFPNLLENPLINSLEKEIYQQGYDLDDLLNNEIYEEKIDNVLLHQFEWKIYQSLYDDFFREEMEIFYEHFEGQNLYASTQLFKISQISAIDFCIEVLNCQCDSDKWQSLKKLILECGWSFPIENEDDGEYIYIISERPRKLSFDSNNRLHSQGSSALEYADNFKIYAYHGVTIPPKYGKINSNKWQSEWIVTEKNAELRRILIEGIGYERICQELEATSLDTWQEYTLLKIDKNIDIEPIHLLKMTCPSTNKIHALRVPPNLKSAREAITWCNWGIAPESFDIQT